MKKYALFGTAFGAIVLSLISIGAVSAEPIIPIIKEEALVDDGVTLDYEVFAFGDSFFDVFIGNDWTFTEYVSEDYDLNKDYFLFLLQLENQSSVGIGTFTVETTLPIAAAGWNGDEDGWNDLDNPGIYDHNLFIEHEPPLPIIDPQGVSGVSYSGGAVTWEFYPEETVDPFEQSVVLWFCSTEYSEDMSFAVGYKSIPEPSTLLLLGSGLVGLAIHTKRRTKRS